MATLETPAAALAKAGMSNIVINAPGTTSSTVLNLVAGAGVTQIEPGHGLTGTTPLQAVKKLSERPATLYLREVSHFHAGEAFCFGSGPYIVPVFGDYGVSAMVGPDLDAVLAGRPPARLPSCGRRHDGLLRQARGAVGDLDSAWRYRDLRFSRPGLRQVRRRRTDLGHRVGRAARRRTVEQRRPAPKWGGGPSGSRR
jgi:hypothetical protein